MKKIILLMAYCKTLITRSMGWIALLNSGMIMYIFLSRIQEQGFLAEVSLKDLFIWIYFVGIFCLIVMGYVDRRLFHSQEIKYLWRKNEGWVKLLKDVEEIKRKLK